MQVKFAIALGASLIAASVWMARFHETRRHQSSLPGSDLDDDEAAELIARYRPALLSALAGTGE